jgi:hypothetical protein
VEASNPSRQFGDSIKVEVLNDISPVPGAVGFGSQGSDNWMLWKIIGGMLGC